MKVNAFFTYLCYIIILIWIFLQNEELYKLIIITFIIAMTYDNIPKIKGSGKIKGKKK